MHGWRIADLDGSLFQSARETRREVSDQGVHLNRNEPRGPTGYLADARPNAARERKNHQGWISTKDRLPAHHDPVVVYHALDDWMGL